MAKYYKAQKYKTGQTGLMSSSYLMAEFASELDSSNSVCQYGRMIRHARHFYVVVELLLELLLDFRSTIASCRSTILRRKQLEKRRNF